MINTFSPLLDIFKLPSVTLIIALTAIEFELLLDKLTSPTASIAGTTAPNNLSEISIPFSDEIDNLFNPSWVKEFLPCIIFPATVTLPTDSIVVFAWLELELPILLFSKLFITISLFVLLTIEILANPLVLEVVPPPELFVALILTCPPSCFVLNNKILPSLYNAFILLLLAKYADFSFPPQSIILHSPVVGSTIKLESIESVILRFLSL